MNSPRRALLLRRPQQTLPIVGPVLLTIVIGAALIALFNASILIAGILYIPLYFIIAIN